MLSAESWDGPQQNHQHQMKETWETIAVSRIRNL